MNKIVAFINVSLNEIGFIITLIGTVVGIIALWMTVKINNKTNDIKKNIKYFEVKATFKYTRLIVLRKVHDIRDQYQKQGNYNLFEIKEVFTELKEFEDLYSENFKESLNDLSKELNLDFKGKIPKKNMGNVIEIIYRLQRKLENDINVLKEEVGGE